MRPIGWLDTAELLSSTIMSAGPSSAISCFCKTAAGERSDMGSSSASEPDSTSHSSKIARSSASELKTRIP